MESIKANLWLFLLSLVILQSCGVGKYDEGPLVSFHSDKNRIVKEWELKKFNINGEDSTANYKCTSCPFFLKFTKSNLLIANYMINGQQQSVNEGSWNFESKDKQVNLLTSENVLTLPIINNGAWDITRSTKKQLWISTYKNGKLYEIQME
jgi:hypothetical protein